MAFELTEKNGLSWVTSDVLETKHMFTRRLGGVGDFPYSSNPDPEWERPEIQRRVRAQWLALRDAGGFPAEGFCFTRQVHATHIRYVTASERKIPPLEHKPEDCDGLITDRPGVPLCVFTADCVPVLLHEPAAGIAAAVHSGWKGTVQDMMGAAVRAIRDMGGRPENIRAAIGPAISQCCFETGVEGKYMVDLKEANRRRLLQLGVAAERIDVSPDCTMCMADLYWSHRATRGQRGTQASIIML